jgi:hypothetical protein
LTLLGASTICANTASAKVLDRIFFWREPAPAGKVVSNDIYYCKRYSNTQKRDYNTAKKAYCKGTDKQAISYLPYVEEEAYYQNGMEATAAVKNIPAEKENVGGIRGFIHRIIPFGRP